MDIEVIGDTARVAETQRGILFELIEFYETEARRRESELLVLEDSAARLTAERDSLAAASAQYAAQLERIRSIPAIRIARRVRRGLRALTGR
ncbi:hypothetical protein [Agromyces sp. SYSU T00266]|uniref:hypothetical protein n=1 Tax=Agromyces zhanjiangensis TaxID=3158562 RepID=UPI003393E327